MCDPLCAFQCRRGCEDDQGEQRKEASSLRTNGDKVGSEKLEKAIDEIKNNFEKKKGSSPVVVRDLATENRHSDAVI